MHVPADHIIWETALYGKSYYMGKIKPYLHNANDVEEKVAAKYSYAFK